MNAGSRGGADILSPSLQAEDAADVRLSQAGEAPRRRWQTPICRNVSLPTATHASGNQGTDDPEALS